MLGLRHRPILVVAAAVGVLVGVLCFRLGQTPQAAMLLGWSASALSYVVPTFVLMRKTTPEAMRRRAELLDEGEAAILTASLVAAVASLGPVVWYLSRGAGPPRMSAVILALGTVGLSWVFVHVLFAVRYAHEYWQAGGGLDFPGDEQPTFDDFLYFAFTIGMTFQTSDVAVSARLLRQLALVHALVSFLFNVFILATAVNLAAGMLA